MGSESLLNQAESMWKMLDDMAESDPDAYKKFIDKALKDGATSFKPPEPCFCISTILVSIELSRSPTPCCKRDKFTVNVWEKL